VPFGVSLWRHSGLDDDEAQRRWNTAVERLVAETFARIRREQRELEVEGSS